MKDNSRINRSELANKFNSTELKEYLNYVINTEIQKPISEMDADLISECVDWSLELDGRQVEIPEEKVKMITKSIAEKHYKRKRRRFIFKLLAAGVVIVLGIQIVSATAFHENLFKDVYGEAKHIIYFLYHDKSQ